MFDTIHRNRKNHKAQKRIFFFSTRCLIYTKKHIVIANHGSNDYRLEHDIPYRDFFMVNSQETQQMFRNWANINVL